MKFPIFKRIAVGLLSLCILTTSAAAVANTSISFNKVGVCNFGPDSGNLALSYDDSEAITTLTFTYSASDAAAIKNYNENGYDNQTVAVASAYAGVDIKAVPNGDETMDAYSVSSSLPNPKYDIESDGGADYSEEAEVVALGTVEAKSYWMIAKWEDHREGKTSDGGQWNVNAELSYHGVSDYNVIPNFFGTGMDAWSSLCQLTYGNTAGAMSISPITTTGSASIASSTDAVADASVDTIAVAQKLNAYTDTVVARNVDIVGSNLEDVASTITFSKYLSLEEFADYAEAHDLDTVHLLLRGFEEDGTRVTIFTKTHQGLEETMAGLSDMAEAGNYVIAGITAVEALIDADDLEGAMADPLTYLIDTSGDAYSVENDVQNSQQRNSCIGQKCTGYPQPMTWELEDLGLL